MYGFTILMGVFVKIGLWTNQGGGLEYDNVLLECSCTCRVVDTGDYIDVMILLRFQV